MVQARVGENLEAGADGAAFGVVGAIDEAWDASLYDGARAHATRLNGNVQRGAGEAIVPEKTGGFTKNEDFGVGGGVAVADRAVARASEDLAFVDEHSADGYFACDSCGTRFGKCFLHELRIGFHVGQENTMR